MPWKHTLMTSTNNTFTMSLVSTAKISWTTESTAACTSFHQLEEGELFLNQIVIYFWFLRLSQLDVLFMKKLCEKVNIVPIISKADSLTPTELTNFKKKILKELNDNSITIFRIPDCDSDEDEQYLKKDQELKVSEATTERYY